MPHDIYQSSQLLSGKSVVYVNRISGQAGVDARTSNNSQSSLFTKSLRNMVSHEFAHQIGLADHDWTHIVSEASTSTAQNLVPKTNTIAGVKQIVYEYTANNNRPIMHYSHHIDDESNVFHTGKAIQPTSGLMDSTPSVQTYSWTRAVQCGFVSPVYLKIKNPSSPGIRHHDEDICQNDPHWLARDVIGSQNILSMSHLSRTAPATERKLKQLSTEILYACGEHSGASSEAAKHAEKTGECDHTYYACSQGDHDQLQASCSTDANCTA